MKNSLFASAADGHEPLKPSFSVINLISESAFRFDNDTRRIDYVQWGIVGGIANYSHSLLYFDGELV